LLRIRLLLLLVLRATGIGGRRVFTGDREFRVCHQTAEYLRIAAKLDPSSNYSVAGNHDVRKEPTEESLARTGGSPDPIITVSVMRFLRAL